MNAPLHVYLSGKMGNRTGKDVLQERKEAVALCHDNNIYPVDPASTEFIEDSDKLIDLSMDFVTMKNFVAKDLHSMLMCDVVLVLTGDTPSDGTWWEMGVAKAEGIPVIMVCPKRVSGGLMGFSNILVDAMFSTVEEAVEFISNNYELRRD